MQFISDLFSQYASQHKGLDIPQDFTKLALQGMKQLNATTKENVIYALCKGLGTQRPDGSDSYFPTSRMPMGHCSISCTSSLLSLESMYVCIHVVSFHDQNMPYILLACNTCLQVHSSEDYLGWLQTMYVLFGTKWSKLFCGPLQSVESTEQESSVATGAFNPLQYVTLET